MLWALFFAALAVILNGGSPYMVPKLTKYAKTHIVDNQRRDNVLELMKEAKAKKKDRKKEQQAS